MPYLTHDDDKAPILGPIVPPQKEEGPEWEQDPDNPIIWINRKTQQRETRDARNEGAKRPLEIMGPFGIIFYGVFG